MQDFHKNGGKRDSTRGGQTQSLVRTSTQGKGPVTPEETEPNLPPSVGGTPAEAGGGYGSPQGQGHWQQQFWEVITSKSPPMCCHYPYHTARRLQCWVASGQTTNWKRTQTHPPAHKQTEVLLSPADQSNTQFYPLPVPPIRKLVPNLLDSLIYQTAEARNTMLQPTEQKPQPQKVRKN